VFWTISGCTIISEHYVELEKKPVKPIKELFFFKMVFTKTLMSLKKQSPALSLGK